MARIAAALLVPLACLGCVQQATSGAPPSDAGLAPVSTQLAAQARRIAALETANAGLVTQVARQGEIMSYLATRGPARENTPRQAMRTAAVPFEGGPTIEGGSCCIGGVAGEELTIDVEFDAESPYARVTDMRVVTGLGSLPPGSIDQAQWEPFLPRKQFVVIPPINWIGFYVAVQFRDALGNISQVFTADISVEGMPSPLTITPSP